MHPATDLLLDNIVLKYEESIGGMAARASKLVIDLERESAGGVIRGDKGAFHEWVTEQLILAAWIEAGQDDGEPHLERLKVDSEKVAVPVRPLEKMSVAGSSVPGNEMPETKAGKSVYMLSVDKHVYIDEKFCIAVESKSYTELAMLKRVLVDFMLLQEATGLNLDCVLVQLENSLGGDYALGARRPIGSGAALAVMSYFPTVDLEIITLLSGDRYSNRPIHKPEFYKPLSRGRVEQAVEIIAERFGARL